MTDARLLPATELATRIIVEQAVEPDSQTVAAALAASRVVVTPAELQLVVGGVQSRLFGYGELQELLGDGVSDILVNAPSAVWVDSGGGLRRADIAFSGEGAVRQLAMRLASLAGRRLDEAQPFVDGLLPDGVRLQAALPPIAVAGTCLSLRFPTAEAIPISAWSDRPDTHLQSVLRGAASFVVSGRTGAGKTTLLRSILNHWPLSRRVVCIEDVKELNLQLPNAVMLQGREANAEGVGAVPMSALVRHALRMRPDSIVVGEVRGPEVLDWLLAASSGHIGSASTVHASSASGALQRLLLLCELAGLPRVTAVAVLADALQYVIHIDLVDGRRQIQEIAPVAELLESTDV